MSLVECKKCAKHISENAFECPHCGFIVNAKTRKMVSDAMKGKACRVCGTMLPLFQHRRERTKSSTGWINGTSFSQSHTTVYHEPCTQCGEPKPHLEPGDKLANKILYALLLIPIFYVANYIGDSTTPSYGQLFLYVALGFWIWFGTFTWTSLLNWNGDL